MMAKLKDYSKLSVQGFLDDLAAPTASPGGGSGAALVAAISCALVEMVAGINGRRNKAKNPDLAKLAKIRARLLVLMTEDVKIFKFLLKSLKKKLSTAQRDSVYLRASSAPIEICRLCVEIAGICEREKKKTSLWLMSDWREAKILARTAFYSAWLNIEVNLNEVKNQRSTRKTRENLANLQAKIDAYAQS